MIEACIVCGEKEKINPVEIKDHLVTLEYFWIVECPNCHFRYIDNPPPADDVYRFYDTEEYVEHSDSAKGIVNYLYHKARVWMIQHKYRLLESHKKKRSLLDFGTGTGYFINEMRARGYNVQGVEISDKARLFGREKLGLPIFHPDELFKNTLASGIGYVTFWHVLEHVYNPEEILARMHSLLDDDGVMIVALPNHTCAEAQHYQVYWNGYDVPRHLWHFTKENFVPFAEHNGFELNRTSFLPLDPYYNCLISESYRKRTWFYLMIPFLATYSLLRAILNIEKASSIVYHLKKKK